MAGFDLYYALLNMGFPLKVSAGSASGVHAVPLGWSRLYVKVEGVFHPEKWFEGARRGRSFATTGPMLFLKVNGLEPGSESRSVAFVAIRFTLDVCYFAFGINPVNESISEPGNCVPDAVDFS